MAVQLGDHTGRATGSPLTGTFEIPLTRAMVAYRDRNDRSPPGGWLHDIGLGVVIDGSDVARAELIDLGSAQLRVADLTGPVPVLGWLYPSGLRSLRRVSTDADSKDLEAARAHTFGTALRALADVGFGPLTRPVMLRIGFRDIAFDLDLHEGTGVRLLLPAGGVARAHLDYDAANLVLRTGKSPRSPELEAGLLEAFPGRALLRSTVADPVGILSYRVEFPMPRNLPELRRLMTRLRSGLARLLERFEPERSRTLRRMSGVFGARDSLRTLRSRDGADRLERVTSVEKAPSGLREVH